MSAPTLNLRFRIDFDFENIDCKISDYTDYSAIGGGTLEGIVKMVGPNGTFYINDGYEGDVFTSPDFSGAYNAGPSVLFKDTIDLPTDSDGLILTGTYYFYMKIKTSAYASDIYTSDEKELNYQVILPVASITVEHSCKLSTLISTDGTDYEITHYDTDGDGTDSDPTSKVIALTNNYPARTGVSAVTVATTTNTIGPNIYTGKYEINLSTTLVYDLESWGSDIWFSINGITKGDDYHTVECDDCACDYYTCIGALQTLRDEAWSARDVNEFKKLNKYLDDVETNYMLWQMAESCGQDGSTYCTNIANILSNADCSCSSADDSISTVVTPWAALAGAGSTTVNQWHSGAGAPSVGLGDNGDFYLRTSNNDVYKKAAGVWAVVTNIQGSSGSAGNTNILYSDISDDATPAGVGLAPLKTYTLAGGTMTLDGDLVVVEALYEFALNANQKTISLYWGGSAISALVSTALVNATTKYAKLIMEISRTGATAQFIEYSSEQSGIPSRRSAPYITTKAETLSGNIDIIAYGQNAIVSAGDIISKSLIVKLFRKTS